MQPYLVWVDGKTVSAEAAQISVGSAAARYGINAFEGICGYVSSSGELSIFRLEDHVRRLSHSARLMRLEHLYSQADFTAAVLECLKANHVRQDCQIRLTLFVVGEGNSATKGPVSLVCGVSHRSSRGLEERSVTASVSSWTRIDDAVMAPRVKAGANYLNGRYALLDAQAAGYDEAILLTRSGKVAEACSACIFLVRGGELVTPRITDSVLESITRDTILEIARADLGLPVTEREIDRSELLLADEVFLCGSAYEVTPVISIDGVRVGTGEPGPVTKALWGSYEAVVRNAAPAWTGRKWLTPAGLPLQAGA